MEPAQIRTIKAHADKMHELGKIGPKDIYDAVIKLSVITGASRTDVLFFLTDELDKLIEK